MNTVQIMGNLARDPEVRYTQSGKAVATVTVAASNTYIDSNNETKEQTAFINCVARSYETADGQKRYVTEVVANFVGTSLTNDETASSNFDSFEQQQDENIPF